MAHKYKRDGVWYIRYKNEAGKWKNKSCGKKANNTDAEYLANDFSAKELNQHHKAPVRIITNSLSQALIQFRDTVIPRSTMGIDKQGKQLDPQGKGNGEQFH